MLAIVGIFFFTQKKESEIRGKERRVSGNDDGLGARREAGGSVGQPRGRAASTASQHLLQTPLSNIL